MRVNRSGAAAFETCFLSGTESMRTTVFRVLRFIEIVSPALTSFDDFAVIPLTSISPASQNSWARLRLGTNLLSFRKTSSLISKIKAGR